MSQFFTEPNNKIYLVFQLPEDLLLQKDPSKVPSSKDTPILPGVFKAQKELDEKAEKLCLGYAFVNALDEDLFTYHGVMDSRHTDPKRVATLIPKIRQRGLLRECEPILIAIPEAVGRNIPWNKFDKLKSKNGPLLNEWLSQDETAMVINGHTRFAAILALYKELEEELKIENAREIVDDALVESIEFLMGELTRWHVKVYKLEGLASRVSGVAQQTNALLVHLAKNLAETGTVNTVHEQIKLAFGPTNHNKDKASTAMETGSKLLALISKNWPVWYFYLHHLVYLNTDFTGNLTVGNILEKINQSKTCHIVCRILGNSVQAIWSMITVQTESAVKIFPFLISGAMAKTLAASAKGLGRCHSKKSPPIRSRKDQATYYTRDYQANVIKHFDGAIKQYKDSKVNKFPNFPEVPLALATLHTQLHEPGRLLPPLNTTYWYPEFVVDAHQLGERIYTGLRLACLYLDPLYSTLGPEVYRATKQSMGAPENVVMGYQDPSSVFLDLVEMVNPNHRIRTQGIENWAREVLLPFSAAATFSDMAILNIQPKPYRPTTFGGKGFVRTILANALPWYIITERGQVPSDDHQKNWDAAVAKYGLSTLNSLLKEMTNSAFWKTLKVAPVSQLTQTHCARMLDGLIWCKSPEADEVARALNRVPEWHDTMDSLGPSQGFPSSQPLRSLTPAIGSNNFDRSHCTRFRIPYEDVMLFYEDEDHRPEKPCIGDQPPLEIEDEDNIHISPEEKHQRRQMQNPPLTPDEEEKAKAEVAKEQKEWVAAREARKKKAQALPPLRGKQGAALEKKKREEEEGENSEEEEAGDDDDEEKDDEEEGDDEDEEKGDEDELEDDDEENDEARKKKQEEEDEAKRLAAEAAKKAGEDETSQPSNPASTQPTRNDGNEDGGKKDKSSSDSEKNEEYLQALHKKLAMNNKPSDTAADLGAQEPSPADDAMYISDGDKTPPSKDLPLPSTPIRANRIAALKKPSQITPSRAYSLGPVVKETPTMPARARSTGPASPEDMRKVSHWANMHRIKPVALLEPHAESNEAQVPGSSPVDEPSPDAPEDVPATNMDIDDQGAIDDGMPCPSTQDSGSEDQYEFPPILWQSMPVPTLSQTRMLSAQVKEEDPCLANWIDGVLCRTREGKRDQSKPANHLALQTMSSAMVVFHYLLYIKSFATVTKNLHSLHIDYWLWLALSDPRHTKESLNSWKPVAFPGDTLPRHPLIFMPNPFNKEVLEMMLPTLISLWGYHTIAAVSYAHLPLPSAYGQGGIVILVDMDERIIQKLANIMGNCMDDYQRSTYFEALFENIHLSLELGEVLMMDEKDDEGSNYEEEGGDGESSEDEEAQVGQKRQRRQLKGQESSPSMKRISKKSRAVSPSKNL